MMHLFHEALNDRISVLLSLNALMFEYLLQLKHVNAFGVFPYASCKQLDV